MHYMHFSLHCMLKVVARVWSKFFFLVFLGGRGKEVQMEGGIMSFLPQNEMG